MEDHESVEEPMENGIGDQRDRIEIFGWRNSEIGDPSGSFN